MLLLNSSDKLSVLKIKQNGWVCEPYKKLKRRYWYFECLGGSYIICTILNTSASCVLVHSLAFTVHCTNLPHLDLLICLKVLDFSLHWITLWTFFHSLLLWKHGCTFSLTRTTSPYSKDPLLDSLNVLTALLCLT